MLSKKVGLAACIMCAAVQAQAELTVNQEFRVAATLPSSESVRTFYIEESGLTIRKLILMNGFDEQKTLVTMAQNPTSTNELLDKYDALLSGESPLYSNGEASFRALFENYPDVPTSPEAEALLSILGLSVPANTEEFNRIVSHVLHVSTASLADLVEVNETPVRVTDGEELVGNSASYYYFTQWNNVGNDADVYRCDKSTYDFSEAAYLQEQANICEKIMTDITLNSPDGSLQFANYYDLVAARDNRGLEPHQVVLPSGLQVEINPVNTQELIDMGAGDYLSKLSINLGKKPIVFESFSPTMNLFELTAVAQGQSYDDLISGGIDFQALNDGIFYIHEDGFVEELTYVGTDSYLREMNDDYLLITRINQTGTIFSREICSYTLTTNYDGSNGTAQGNLGGTISCDETIKSYPVNNSVALGYDSDIVAVAIYPTLKEGLEGTPFLGVPAYIENIITGEHISLSQIERDFRGQQGLSTFYGDDTLLRQTFLNTYKASVDIGDLEPGLMDNYPSIPTNFAAFDIMPGTSDDDFVALIEKAENFAMEFNTLAPVLGFSDELQFNSDEYFPVFSEVQEAIAQSLATYSRNVFKFTSPTELMSAEALYTFENTTTGSITGSALLPNNEVPATGITITLTSSSGSVLTTTIDALGNYTFSDLAEDDYQLSYSYDYHVAPCTTASLTAGQNIDLGKVELAGGDFNDDGVINSSDLWIYAFRIFYNRDFDINNDGTVNTQDKAMLNANQGMTQCQI